MASADEDGDDSRIELSEIQFAISWWSDDEPVPNTGGETIDLPEIQRLIGLWADDAEIDEDTDLSG